MSTSSPQPEEPPADIAADSGEIAPAPSCSREGTKKIAGTARRRRRKRNHHKMYEPGNSKSMRRIKRLGYTPEHNKRGYKRRKPQLNGGAAEDFPALNNDSVAVVSVNVEYPYERKRQRTKCDEAGNGGQRRKVFYTYTKVNGKSVRYLNETAEEQAARRAKYKERNRKYSEKETEEQHRQRLERRRLRRIADRLSAGQAVVKRKRRSEQEIEADKLLKDIKIITVCTDEEHLETLQREYAEFNRYVAEKLQDSKETQNRQLEIAYWQHDPEQGNSPLETTHPASVLGYSSPIGNNGYHNARQKPPNTVLYSNDPIDPDIALLETSDETFVPVQVIIQTCDDFDDMLEFENA